MTSPRPHAAGPQTGDSPTTAPAKETAIKKPRENRSADALQIAVMKILLQARRTAPAATSSKDPALQSFIWDAIVAMQPTIEKQAKRASRNRRVDEYDVATKSSDALRQTLGQMIVGKSELPASISAVIATAVDRKAASLQKLECDRNQRFRFLSFDDDDEPVTVNSKQERDAEDATTGGYVLVAFEQRVTLDTALAAADKLPRLQRAAIVASMLGTPDDIAAAIYHTTPNALRVARCSARKVLRPLITDTTTTQEVAA